MQTQVQQAVWAKFGPAALIPRGTLSDRDFAILSAHVEQGITYTALAPLYGVTRERVAQIARRAARKLGCNPTILNQHYGETYEDRQARYRVEDRKRQDAVFARWRASLS